MRFKVDENLPTEVARLLGEAGHDATTVIEEELSGAADSVLIDECRSEGRVLITLDLDFADIRTYPPPLSIGIIVLRPITQDMPSVLHLVSQIPSLLTRERLEQRLWILEANRLRIRGDD